LDRLLQQVRWGQSGRWRRQDLSVLLDQLRPQDPSAQSPLQDQSVPSLLQGQSGQSRRPGQWDRLGLSVLSLQRVPLDQSLRPDLLDQWHRQDRWDLLLLWLRQVLSVPSLQRVL
jgi:hypothetical protein